MPRAIKMYIAFQYLILSENQQKHWRRHISAILLEVEGTCIINAIHLNSSSGEWLMLKIVWERTKEKVVFYRLLVMVCSLMFFPFSISFLLLFLETSYFSFQHSHPTKAVLSLNRVLWMSCVFSQRWIQHFSLRMKGESSSVERK